MTQQVILWQRFMAWVVVSLTLVGIVVCIGHYIPDPSPRWVMANQPLPGPQWYLEQRPRYQQHPWMTALHILPAALLLMIIPFNLSHSLRRRFPQWHRRMGRVFVVLAVITSAAGLAIGFVFPFAGVVETLAIVLLGALFLFTTANGVRYIRQRQIRRHREWMLRSVAVALTPATMRLVFMLVLATTGAQAVDVFVPSMMVSLVINGAVVQGWIRYTQARRKTSAGPEIAVFS